LKPEKRSECQLIRDEKQIRIGQKGNQNVTRKDFLASPEPEGKGTTCGGQILKGLKEKKGLKKGQHQKKKKTVYSIGDEKETGLTSARVPGKKRSVAGRLTTGTVSTRGRARVAKKTNS